MKVKGKGFQHCVKYEFQPRKVILETREMKNLEIPSHVQLHFLLLPLLLIVESIKDAACCTTF